MLSRGQPIGNDCRQPGAHIRIHCMISHEIETEMLGAERLRKGDKCKY